MRTLTIFLLVLNILFAPTLFGEVYEADGFSKLNNTIIRLEGPMTVQLIANGNYSVNLLPGSYVLTASYQQAGKLEYYIQEKISVNQAQARFDIVLLPAELQRLVPKGEPEEDKQKEEQSSQEIKFDFNITALIVLAILLALIIIYLLYKNLHKPKEVKLQETKEEEELDDEQLKAIEIIKNSNGRIGQKELREVLGYSESNMSLLAAELESVGYIKIIRKGRNNVLKLIKLPSVK